MPPNVSVLSGIVSIPAPCGQCWYDDDVFVSVSVFVYVFVFVPVLYMQSASRCWTKHCHSARGGEERVGGQASGSIAELVPCCL